MLLALLFFDKGSVDAGDYAFSWAGSDRGRSVRSTTRLVCFSLFLGACKGGSVLLEGGFRSFEEEGVHALIEVITCHVVVDHAKSMHKYGSAVILVDIILDLRQLAFLLDDFNWLTPILACFGCFWGHIG